MSEKLKGIDVSGYQGNIDFKKVKESGVDFVIIKAGYSTSTVDTWEKNYANAKESGLKVGAYWYSYALDITQGYAEARAFIEALKGKQLDFPVYMDLEEMAQLVKGRAFCTSLVEAFCETLEEAGYYTGLYGSTYWITSCVEENVREKRPLWVADYRGKCYYTGTYGIWQYGTGSVQGVQNKCDLDEGYIDYAEHIIENGLNGYTKNKPTPESYTVEISNFSDEASAKRFVTALNVISSYLNELEFLVKTNK